MKWPTFLLFLVLASAKLAETKQMRNVEPLFNDDDDLLSSDEVISEGAKKADSRTGKLFSLFNIVQFKNSGCRSQSSQSPSGTGATTRNGTCYTSTECSSRGGTASGNCAAGFGVCCIFFVSASSSTIFQNCTYIRNPGYPTAYTGGGGMVTYTIKKCSQMYLDLGNSATDTATLTFTFMAAPTTTTTARTWEIKVTQIPCYGTGSGSLTYVPPPGCLQYVTGLTGRLTTFNFIPTNDNQLASQDYQICIRQEAGYCCVLYQVCSDTNSYTLDTQNVAAPARTASIDSHCFVKKDYIEIPGAMSSCMQGSSFLPTVTRFCGGIFSTLEEAKVNSPVCTCLQPFFVAVTTNSLSDAASATIANTAMALSRGLCLTYTQIPCAS